MKTIRNDSTCRHAFMAAVVRSTFALGSAVFRFLPAVFAAACVAMSSAASALESGDVARTDAFAIPRAEFAKYGIVEQARIVTHPSGKSKGYGFVLMPHRAEVEIACKALNGANVMGRTLRVNEARGSNR